jgi:phosphoribosyl-ATP pyrophosphohydrolase
MASDIGDWAALARLHATVIGRMGADPEQSYTARLLAQGTAKIAKKLGEEAVEVALAAAYKDREGVIGESVDLLYHLMVLWVDQDIQPKDVMERLGAREARSGLAEKAARSANKDER